MHHSGRLFILSRSPPLAYTFQVSFYPVQRPTFGMYHSGELPSLVRNLPSGFTVIRQSPFFESLHLLSFPQLHTVCTQRPQDTQWALKAHHSQNHTTHTHTLCDTHSPPKKIHNPITHITQTKSNPMPQAPHTGSTTQHTQIPATHTHTHTHTHTNPNTLETHRHKHTHKHSTDTHHITCPSSQNPTNPPDTNPKHTLTPNKATSHPHSTENAHKSLTT